LPEGSLHTKDAEQDMVKLILQPLQNRFKKFWLRVSFRFILPATMFVSGPPRSHRLFAISKFVAPVREGEMRVGNVQKLYRALQADFEFDLPDCLCRHVFSSLC